MQIFMPTLATDPNSNPAFAPAVPRDLCTDYGVSRTDDPKRCGRACQFIVPDYPAPEVQVHYPAISSPSPAERASTTPTCSPTSPSAIWAGRASNGWSRPTASYRKTMNDQLTRDTGASRSRLCSDRVGQRRPKGCAGDGRRSPGLTVKVSRFGSC